MAFLSNLVNGISLGSIYAIIALGYTMVYGIAKMLKKENLARGINVEMKGNSLILDFHVIVSYGVNIRAVASNLVNNVKYKIEEFTGFDIDRINVYVEGVRVID